MSGPFVEVRRARGGRAWVNMANVAWITEDDRRGTRIVFGFARGDDQRPTRLRVQDRARDILAKATLRPPASPAADSGSGDTPAR